MKVLLDACVAAEARDSLRATGHEVVWAGDWREDPGDETILARAHAEGRVLVTLDKDFGEPWRSARTATLRCYPACKLSVQGAGPASAEVLRTYAEHLDAGAIITAEPGRARIRRPQA